MNLESVTSVGLPVVSLLDVRGFMVSGGFHHSGMKPLQFGTSLTYVVNILHYYYLMLLSYLLLKYFNNCGYCNKTATIWIGIPSIS